MYRRIQNSALSREQKTQVVALCVKDEQVLKNINDIPEDLFCDEVLVSLISAPTTQGNSKQHVLIHKNISLIFNLFYFQYPLFHFLIFFLFLFSLKSSSHFIAFFLFILFCF
jgi:hypothetical protein